MRVRAFPIEDMARALCQVTGVDPDRSVDGAPAWQSVSILEEARRALMAIEILEAQPDLFGAVS